MLVMTYEAVPYFISLFFLSNYPKHLMYAKFGCTLSQSEVFSSLLFSCSVVIPIFPISCSLSRSPGYSSLSSLDFTVPSPSFPSFFLFFKMVHLSLLMIISHSSLNLFICLHLYYQFIYVFPAQFFIFFSLHIRPQSFTFCLLCVSNKGAFPVHCLQSVSRTQFLPIIGFKECYITL